MGLENTRQLEANENEHAFEIAQEVLSVNIDTRTQLHDLMESTLNTEPPKEPDYWNVDNTVIPSSFSFYLANDPAIPTVSKIDRNWVKELRETGALNALGGLAKNDEITLLVGRALYLNNLEVTKEHVHKVLLAIVEVQKLYEKVPLYKNRNVVVAFANERLEDSMNDNFKDKENENTQKIRAKVAESGDTHTFGRNAYVENIKRQNPKTEVLRTEDGPEGIVKMRDAIKNKIINTPPPFTFEWEGHGITKDGSAILLNGIHNKEAKITAEEISQWLIARYEKYPELLNASKDMQDIIIWKQCYNHEFLRVVYAQLREKFDEGQTLPLQIGDAEFGMIATTQYTNKYGNPLTEGIVTEQTSTLGSVMNMQRGPMSLQFLNPSMYTSIPDEILEKVGLEKGFLLQFTENETKASDDPNALPGQTVDLPYDERVGDA